MNRFTDTVRRVIGDYAETFNLSRAALALEFFGWLAVMAVSVISSALFLAAVGGPS